MTVTTLPAEGAALGSGTASLEHSRGVLGWLRNNQVLAFTLLAYALSWWMWFLYRSAPDQTDAPILTFGPLLAALVMLPLVGGRAALRGFLGQMVTWRVGLRWYGVALSPVLITVAAQGLNRMTGAQVVADFQMLGLAEILAGSAMLFVFIGLAEEPAWRGFVLARLLKTHGGLAAALILGAIHVVWHLPLFGVEYFPSNVLPWAAGVVSASVVTCWVYQHTRGSLLLPMLMHTATNASGRVVWPMFEGADVTRLWWIWSGLWVAMAVAVVLLAGRNLRRP
jgi:membrane protease YdiL (CAAX protease family)